jgi:hypothetical protein
MPKIGGREVYFVNAMNTQQIDFLIEKVREVVEELKLPADYDVKIYKNVLSCCGIGGLSIVIEVVGPDEDGIKAIDVRAMSRILEFCEKEGLEVGHHSVGQYESM